MQQSPEIIFRDIESSDAVINKVRERIERLERYVPEIISCRVVIAVPHRKKRTGRLYNVTLDVSVPGDQILVNRNPERDQSHEDVYVAIRDAFKAAERQLKEYNERRRGQIKSHEGHPRGIVDRLFEDDGYGFITPREGGGHVYFHENAIVDADFEEPVSFHEEEGEKGPQASTVHVLSDREVVPGGG